MAKAGELDWSEELNKSDNYVHIPTALWAADQHSGGKQGVDPLNKGEPILKKGEVPYRPSNEEIANYILKDYQNSNLGQWKDSEHLHKEIVSQDQAEEMQKNWENSIQGFYEAASKPVVSKEQEELEWGSGKSFNETISEEERLKRNMFTGD